MGSILSTSLNARILSISDPVLPELLPLESGLYEVIVLAKIVLKFKLSFSHEFSASRNISVLSPFMYGRWKLTFSESQLPILNDSSRLS